MDLATDSVAEAVNEVIVEAEFFKVVMANIKNVFCILTCLDFFYCQLLGVGNVAVGVLLDAVCAADKNRPGKIGTIIVEFGAEIKKECIAFFYFSVASCVMRKGGIWAGCDY